MDNIIPGFAVPIRQYLSLIHICKRHIYKEAAGWTIRTRDKKPEAHFEHTVAVGKNGADILSTFEYVEQVLHKS